MSRPTAGSPEQLMPDLTYRVASSALDRARVLRLRETVYVHDQARLGDVNDMATTFDRFDANAVYLLALHGDVPIGAIKVCRDADGGLPCEDIVDLGQLRSNGRPVEFGHLMTIPRMRNQAVGLGLMRAALVHSVVEYRSTHVVGDFFIDDVGRLRAFYTMIGFVPVGEPYRDERFKGAPLSVVALLDLNAAAARRHTATGREQALLHYFFHDYDQLIARATEPRPGRR
jgi:GNAT superfamily N-acetyltransferase